MSYTWPSQGFSPAYGAFARPYIGYGYGSQYMAFLQDFNAAQNRGPRAYFANRYGAHVGRTSYS